MPKAKYEEITEYLKLDNERLEDAIKNKSEALGKEGVARLEGALSQNKSFGKILYRVEPEEENEELIDASALCHAASASIKIGAQQLENGLDSFTTNDGLLEKTSVDLRGEFESGLIVVTVKVAPKELVVEQ